MTILLDTHAFLWFSTDSPRLSEHAKQIIEDRGNVKLLSVAVAWEIAIKVALGKLSVAGSVESLLNGALSKTHWRLFGITVRHLGSVSSLPFHHRDPFDRLLVSQSLVENVAIVSQDEQLDAYGVQRSW